MTQIVKIMKIIETVALSETIAKYMAIIIVILLCLRIYTTYKNINKFNKMSKIELFFEYDKKNNFDNGEEILKMMRLLGYYCFNINKLKKMYIDAVMILIINNKNKNVNQYLDDCNIISTKNINDYTVGELEQQIIKTQKYITFEKMLYDKLKRSISLSKHLNDKTTQHFYKSINEDEINELDVLKILSKDKKSIYFL